MRYAFLTELYLPSVGGQETRFAALAEELVRRGHDVSVVCIGHCRDLPAHETINGVAVHRVSWSSRYTRPRIPGLPRPPLAILRYALAVRRWCKHTTVDVTVLNQWPYLHAVALPRDRRRHAIIDWCEVRESFVYRQAQAHLPGLVRGNFALNRAIADRLSGSHQTWVLPSGTHTSRFRPAPLRDRSATILYIGRLVPHKQLSLVIEAFTKADAVARLVIAGEGPERARLDKQVRRLPDSIASRIELLGHIDEETKLDLLGQASCLVIASLREGFPNIVTEALASGTPILTVEAPDNGTAVVVRDLGVGLVVGNDIRSLAEGMREVRARHFELSQTCLHISDSLDWKRLADEFEAATRSVASLPRKPA